MDGGATINLMSHSLLKKITKYDTDLKPYNLVMSNYEGKTSYSLRVIQLDIVVEAIARPTLFVFILTKENYNLLLGWEWIHGERVIP